MNSEANKMNQVAKALAFALSLSLLALSCTADKAS